MKELIVNLHVHTLYSDGSGLHKEISQIATKLGLDVVITTDHNVLVHGLDGYVRSNSHRTLLLVGEEIHDQDRDPQKNHLLVFGVNQELSPYADEPQVLIDKIRNEGGLCFIAHPVDPELATFNEDDISWETWDVDGFTGIELWNGFSELKTIVKNKIQGLLYAYFPEFIPRGPMLETLAIWDDLLSKGRRVVAIGGSDSHARHMSLGPLRRIIFPYSYHFSTINNHLIVPRPLSGNLQEDREMIYTALAGGHSYIGNDLPASTRGFRFSAHGHQKNAIMGDEIPLRKSITLHIRLPKQAECRVVRNGEIVKIAEAETLTLHVTQPGAYRVEAYLKYLGKKRGWIFSNPIYVR